MEKCVGCQYYDRDEVHAQDKGVRWGKCRRTGPMVHPVSAKSYMVEGVWPSVRDDDWCGEWAASKRRPDAAAIDARNAMLMQSAATPVRPSAAPAGSLMVPVPSGAPANDAPIIPIAGRFGSD